MPYGGYFGGGSDKSKQIEKLTGIKGTKFGSKKKTSKKKTTNKKSK